MGEYIQLSERTGPRWPRARGPPLEGEPASARVWFMGGTGVAVSRVYGQTVIIDKARTRLESWNRRIYLSMSLPRCPLRGRRAPQGDLRQPELVPVASILAAKLCLRKSACDCICPAWLSTGAVKSRSSVSRQRLDYQISGTSTIQTGFVLWCEYGVWSTVGFSPLLGKVHRTCPLAEERGKGVRSRKEPGAVDLVARQGERVRAREVT